MENMMDLFQEEAEVKDEPNAPDLKIENAAVEFRDVAFSYVPERQVLNKLSFSIPAGHTVAFVSFKIHVVGYINIQYLLCRKACISSP